MIVSWAVSNMTYDLLFLVVFFFSGVKTNVSHSGSFVKDTLVPNALVVLEYHLTCVFEDLAQTSTGLLADLMCLFTEHFLLFLAAQDKLHFYCCS